MENKSKPKKPDKTYFESSTIDFKKKDTAKRLEKVLEYLEKSYKRK